LKVGLALGVARRLIAGLVSLGWILFRVSR